MLKSFESVLYLISTGLFYPVLTGLVAMACWTVVCLGSFLREIVDRRRKKISLTGQFKKQYKAQIPEALANKAYADIALTKLLRSWERKQISKLDRVRFMIKTAPALGLIGTLIPMGRSLAALSQGDMMAMSVNMVTAFTTTIVGVACGIVAYLISMAREKWLKAAFLECEIYCELLLRDQEQEAEMIKIMPCL